MLVSVCVFLFFFAATSLSGTDQASISLQHRGPAIRQTTATRCKSEMKNTVCPVAASRGSSGLQQQQVSTWYVRLFPSCLRRTVGAFGVGLIGGRVQFCTSIITLSSFELCPPGARHAGPARALKGRVDSHVSEGGREGEDRDREVGL